MIDMLTTFDDNRSRSTTACSNGPRFDRNIGPYSSTQSWTIRRTPQEGTSRAKEGPADKQALVAAKLDRLSRSMLGLASLIATAQKQGWALVALDCALVPTTPAGEATANVLATFAQFERGLISKRTRQALALRRSQGVRLGRPPTISQYVIN